MSELILHHYDLSPYSEKVRLIFGWKGLAWRSVIVPMILPKPDLMPLTGGFRRTPVLQIGADIYCDTNLIAAELERRFPTPSIVPPAGAGLSAIVAMWADRVLFLPTARYVTGVNSAKLPQIFHADRAAMRGHATPTAEALAAEAPHHRGQLLLQLAAIADLLRDGRAYLLGEQPSVADFAVYGRVWWLDAFGPSGLPLDKTVVDWAARIARIGHGRRSETTPAEALDRAATAEPDQSPPGGEGPLLGRTVTVATEGFGPDPVTGEVVFDSATEIAVRRSDDRTGTVVVHFPRLGYEIRPA